MLVLTGPSGSGKSAFVLDRFREAVRAGRTDMRLLVPTATLVEHLRHERAREGLIFRPELIQTFSKFASSLAADARLVSRPLFYVIVEDALRRVAPGEFARVSDAPGFPASVAQTIEMLDAAGCDAAALARLRSDAPLGPALALVWREVAEQLRARGLVTRAGLLRRAAQGNTSVREIWFDGFGAFSDPELELVGTLAANREIVITLPLDGASLATRERFVGMGAEVRERQATKNDGLSYGVVRFVADSVEREVEEIARRILGSGREFREIGVALRNPERYAGLIEGVFERFGIPARFYFGGDLAKSPAAAYLIATVDALLSGWEHEQSLAALRLAPRVGVSSAMDRLDFEVRKQLPGRGVAAIKNLAYKQSLTRVLEEWERLDAWRSRKLAPAAWADELGSLRALFTPGQIDDGQAWSSVVMYRSQTAALDLFASALEEAADWWNGGTEPIPLEEFWRVAKAIMRITSLRVEDNRRNVVHVMSVYEARQWDLKLVFLCGLAEKEFPRRHPQNSFVPDAAIRRLQQAGMRVATSDDRNGEEEPLFRAVAARAREQLVLSYAREEQNLPSVFYVSAGEEEEATPVRPPAQAQKYKPASAIVSADLLPVLKERSAKPSVTGLEAFLQCPFKFFASRILRLDPPPARPEDRLDFLQQGNIVHQVLADWYRERPDIGEVFEARFREKCAELRVPTSYQTEVLREQMSVALKRFESSELWPRGNSVEIEHKIEIELGDGVTVRARIDRLETLPDGSVVIVDYKYSSAVNTKKKVEDVTLLQGPLYVSGARKAHDVSAMVYYNVRTDPNHQVPKPFGWGTVPGVNANFGPLTDEWVTDGLTKARRAVDEFRSGRVLPRPLDAKNCRYCDFRDACRWEFTAAIGAAGN